MSEEEVRKFTEEYVKARYKGDDKWHLKNADTKAMWENNKEAMGERYEETLEQFQESFKSGLWMLKVDKGLLSIGAIKVEGDYAEVEVNLKGKNMMTPLKLSKTSGKWKYIMGPTWF